MTRRNLPEFYKRIADEAARQSAEYRDLVLHYPDLVARLAQPPISKPDPATWTGYIPPYAVPVADRHVSACWLHVSGLTAAQRRSLASATTTPGGTAAPGSPANRPREID